MADVMIGCKLPNGFIMEIVKPGLLNIPAAPGKRYTIAGANSLRTDERANPLIHKFAYTPVDAEFAAEWFKQNAELAFVKSGAVFQQKNPKDAAAEGREKVRDVVTGIEPLNPDKDKRIPKGVTPDDENKRLKMVAA